jgi:CubicO group peptidase (beta-lactamase class C family)
MGHNRQLREQLDSARRQTGVPGAAVAIVEAEGIQTAETGVASVATGRPVGAATRFPILSITKGYTASLVLRLVQEGRMVLDDRIVQHLPEMRLAEPSQAQAAAMTLRQLLAQTCGLSGLYSPDTGEGEDALERFLPTLAGVGLVHAPGERFSYSNPGYVLAGLITERLTGMPWDSALSERLLGPMGLRETGSRLGQLGGAALAADHRTLPDGTPEVVPPWRPRSQGPAGSTMFATAVDVARFARHQMSPEWARLHEPQIAFPGPHADSWGLGWALFGWGASVFGWDGVGLGMRTFLRILPEHGAAVALLTNGDKGRRVYRALLPRLLSERFGVGMAPERPATVAVDDAPDPAGHLGVYRSAGWDQTVALSEDGRVLLLEGEPLLPTAERGVFVQQGPDVDYPTVLFDGDYANVSCFGFRR